MFTIRYTLIITTLKEKVLNAANDTNTDIDRATIQKELDQFIQQIDDNLVYPRIVGEAVGISGIWVIAGVIIAGGLFGIAGLLIAVPSAAVVYRIAGDWVNRKNERSAAELGRSTLY